MAKRKSFTRMRRSATAYLVKLMQREGWSSSLSAADAFSQGVERIGDQYPKMLNKDVRICVLRAMQKTYKNN